MKVTEVTNEIVGEIKAVEAGVHEAVQEFNSQKGAVWIKAKGKKEKFNYKTNLKEFNESIGYKPTGMVQIPYETIDKLLKITKVVGKSKQIKHVGRDALTLYMFLQKKAIEDDGNFGTNNRPWATRAYCMEGLGWGKGTYDAANKVLVELGLKKKRTHNSKTSGRFLKKEYLELPFVNLHKEEKVVKDSQVNRKPSQPLALVQTTSTDGTNKLNTNSSFGKTEKSLNDKKIGVKTEVQHTVSPRTGANGKISASAWIQEIGFPLSEEDIRYIATRTSMGEGHIKNMQEMFNGNQEADIANGKVENLATTRFGYLIHYSNWLKVFDKTVTSKGGKVVVKKSNGLAWYSDGSMVRTQPYDEDYY